MHVFNWCIKAFILKRLIFTKIVTLKESLWLKCLLSFSAGVWLCEVHHQKAGSPRASGFTSWFWWFNSEFLGVIRLCFSGLSCFDAEPILQSTALGRLCSKSCSSWAQPPGKGQYKTLAPTAYFGICWQCQWFSVSDGHVVDCRNHSPVSFFYKYLLQSAAPESLEDRWE